MITFVLPDPGPASTSWKPLPVTAFSCEGLRGILDRMIGVWQEKGGGKGGGRGDSILIVSGLYDT